MDGWVTRGCMVGWWLILDADEHDDDDDDEEEVDNDYVIHVEDVSGLVVRSFC